MTKKIDLEKIPTLLEKAVAVIDKDLDTLAAKDKLTTEESRTLIAYVGTLDTIYKNYRAEVSAIKKELKELPKEDLAAIIRAEGN